MTAAVQSNADPDIFLLERFAWEGVDRLQVSGVWGGGASPRTDGAVLVVRSGDATHRLPALPEPVTGSPANGRSWSAAFAWPDGPTAFERAELEFGGEAVTELPQPRPKRLRRSHRRLPARRVEDSGSASSVDATRGLARAADLVLAREETLSVGVRVEQLRQQLDRARADVESERRGRSADAESFRQALASLRTTAEQALNAERTTARKLDLELREARQRLADKEALVAELELVASDAARRHSLIESAHAQTQQLLEKLTALQDTLAAQTHV